MKSRGQQSFVNLPSFAAKLYNSLTRTKAIESQHQEIASELVSKMSRGRLLDIGTGPGKLLREVHRLNPGIELFGLDISEAMVHLARKNLAGIKADLQCGDIQHSGYAADFFDVVTCTGSFYLWDQPEAGLEEVFRILKRDRSAYLYETYQDFNPDQVRAAIQANLHGESFARRLVTPVFLMRQLRMTYRMEEIADIILRTSFAKRYTIEQISMTGLPAWVRVQLTRA